MFYKLKKKIAKIGLNRRRYNVTSLHTKEKHFGQILF